MPFKSAAQRRFLFAKHPQMAKRWAQEEKAVSKSLVNIAKEDRKMRVLVSGGRDYDNTEGINSRLDKVGRRRDLEVIEGGAKGADVTAGQWAIMNGRKHRRFPANWKAHGRSAGPRRNQQMLEEGKPDLHLAFSNDIKGSKGTRDMVKRTKKAGVPTVVYDRDAKPVRRRDTE